MVRGPVEAKEAREAKVARAAKEERATAEELGPTASKAPATSAARPAIWRTPVLTEGMEVASGKRTRALPQLLRSKA